MMKTREAFEVAMRDDGFKKSYERFVERSHEITFGTSLIFSIGNEAFYVSADAVYDPSTCLFRHEYQKGKHTAKRSEYLIRTGQAYKVKAGA